MKPSYEDITSRIDEKISWYDANGTPRYGKFSPEKASSVYAECVVLLRIACQDCKEEFLVEVIQERFLGDHSLTKNMELWLEKGAKDMHRQLPMHYGDPPRHGCQVGETENCIDLKVEEFWHRENMKWVRIPAYEIELEKMEEI